MSSEMTLRLVSFCSIGLLESSPASFLGVFRETDEDKMYDYMTGS